nr:MAG TPA: hypothetical protein [Bacteriophage sp.]
MIFMLIVSMVILLFLVIKFSMYRMSKTYI